MFFQVYDNPFIGDRIMTTKKWEVRRFVHYVYVTNGHILYSEYGLNANIWNIAHF